MEIIDVSKMAKRMEYIRTHLSERSIMEQLAEECAELSKASLKTVRALGMSENVTPTSGMEALNNLHEEMVDVLMVYFLYRGELPIMDMYASPKWKRWAERLGYKE